MHLLGLTGIKVSFAGITLPLSTLIILLISAGIAVLTLGITLSPRVDYLNGFVLLSLLFFFLFRDVWEHHYVMIIPLLVLMYATDRLPFWVTLLIFVLVASPTPFPFLHFNRGKILLERLHIYDVVFYGYFFIKQSGVIIFYWQTLKSVCKIPFNSSRVQISVKN